MTSLDVLIAAVDSPDRDVLSRTLLAQGHRVAIDKTPAVALRRLAQARPDLVVIDLAGAQGVPRLLRAVSDLKVLVPAVVVSDRRDPVRVADALRLGALDVLVRPLDPHAIAAAVENARELARLAARQAASADPEPPASNGIFAASPAMRSLLELVRRVARTRCNVLIVGERGSGRGLVARAIHHESLKAADEVSGGGGSDFVEVDCGVPIDLDRQRELALMFAAPPAPETPSTPDGFRGRRSDASSRACGAPRGGLQTIFFRSIGDLASPLQGWLERLCASVDASGGAIGAMRLVASADPTMVDTPGRRSLRRELLDRVAVVRIDVPPLRQRVEDIPLLATDFLKDACRRQDVAAKTLSRSARALLAALPWRGNAGELRRLAERLALLVPRGVVLQEDVLEHVRFDDAALRIEPGGTLKEARERFERDYIAAVLQHHHGRMGTAAGELGVERTNLYRKIRQLNIQWGRH